MPDPFRFPEDYGANPTALVGQKTLDGAVYFFRWMPNTRAAAGRGAYYVDLFNARGQALVRGIKVILTSDLWGAVKNSVAGVPPGRLVVRRTDGGVDDPAIYDLTDPANPVQLESVGSANVVIEYVSITEDAATA